MSADDSSVRDWKIWSIIASLFSAAVVLISFLVPSIEDQYDRYRSRQVIQGYVRVGNALLAERKYSLAEDAFAKAFELSENRRLDIEIMRVRSKVEEVNEEGEWARPIRAGLNEVDFIYFINLSQESSDREVASLAHSSYALFLASKHRFSESKKQLELALEQNPSNYDAHVDMANVLMETSKVSEAKVSLKMAIELQPSRYIAHYNLGMLLVEQREVIEGIHSLEKAYDLNPDSAIRFELNKARKIVTELKEKKPN